MTVNVTHSQAGRESTEVSHEMIQVLELSDKNCKAAIINVFKNWKERLVIMSELIGKLLHFSVFLFPRVKNGDKNNTHLRVDDYM